MPKLPARDLPLTIHTAEQVRAMDRYAIEQLGISGYTLMTRAGAAALEVLRSRWPNANRIGVICGSGNNGGDGYVLARLARSAGLEVFVIALFEPSALRGDALTAWKEFAGDGGKTLPWSAETLGHVDLLVDAIFGTGLSRPVDGRMGDCMMAMNASAAPILALDIPSGIAANSGLVMGVAVKADCTVAFVGLKLGFYVGDAPDYVGQLVFCDLGLSQLDAKGSIAERLDAEWLFSVLPRRSRLAHKGTSGHVLIIGGGIGMPGAVRLSGEACLRVGAGLVTVATCAENVASIVIERPELMVRAVGTRDELQGLIERADVVAIGPGLGQDNWARTAVETTFSCDRPLVVDADALNLLASKPLRRGNWILTPHPGEAARLMASTTNAIQRDRFGSVRSLVERYGGVAVLKGTNSWIADEKNVPAVCDRGNPAMSTAGMGDVLTGVIAGLLAQAKELSVAARAGVFAHSVAADRAVVRLGPGVDRGLLASDLFRELPDVVSADE